MKLWRIVFGLVFAILVIGLIDGYLSVVRAYELNPQSMIQAAADAKRLSKYPWPDVRTSTIPRIVADGTLSKMDNCRLCGPRAHYLPDGPVADVEFFYIELGVLNLSDADGHALMVHEWIHFLQRHNGAEWNTCAAEREAVSVQNLYLAEQHLPPVPVWHPGR